MILISFSLLPLFCEETIARLLQLDWGISLTDVENILFAKDESFQKLEHISRNLELADDQDVDENTSLKRLAYITYYSEGVTHFNLRADVVLGFYNPQGSKDDLQLYKVELYFRGQDRDGNPVNIIPVYRDFIELFLSKYKIVLQPAAREDIYSNYIYITEINDVVAIFQVDKANNTIYISYEKQEYKELITQKIQELDQTQVEEVEEVIETKEEQATEEKIETAQIEEQKLGETQGLGIKLMADLSLTPYIYNSFENSFGNDLKFNIGGGVIFNDFLFGGSVFYFYASFDGLDENTTFGGAWAILGGAAIVFYSPFSWLQIQGSVGSSWLASTFEYNELGVERLDAGGLYVGLTGVYKGLADIVVLKVPLRLHMFFGEQAFLPYFFCGLRADFHPLLEWLYFYAEVGVQSWIYAGDFFETSTIFFIGSIGTAIDIDLGNF